MPVALAGDLVEATQDSGEFALMSRVMKTAAVQLSKSATTCAGSRRARAADFTNYAQNSISLVTALNPVLGYEKSAAIH
ncbi:MAG: hypothetical protein WB586_07410 [Chthoniobacterales bacterium]